MSRTAWVGLVLVCLMPSVAAAQGVVIQEESTTPAPILGTPAEASVYVTADPVVAQPSCPMGTSMLIDSYGRTTCVQEVTRHRAIGGLLGGGIGLLVGGYVLSWITGLVEGLAFTFHACFASSGCVAAGDSGAVIGWGFVPLIGSLVELAYFPPNVDAGVYAWNIVESALEIGGLIMLIFGAIGEDVTETVPAGGFAFHMQPMITGTAQGLGATLTF